MSAGLSNTKKTYPWQDWINYMYRQSDHLEIEKLHVISTNQSDQISKIIFIINLYSSCASSQK